jgi:hypothetical protein
MEQSLVEISMSLRCLIGIIIFWSAYFFLSREIKWK